MSKSVRYFLKTAREARWEEIQYLRGLKLSGQGSASTNFRGVESPLKRRAHFGEFRVRPEKGIQ